MTGEKFRVDVQVRQRPELPWSLVHVQVCDDPETAKRTLVQAVSDHTQAMAPESREIMGRVLISMPGMNPVEIARKVVRGTTEVQRWNL